MNLEQISRLDEDEAREYLETLRWNGTPVCPKCDNRGAYALKPKPDSKRPVRKGVYKCKACRRQFTVTVGTIFEDSHIPIRTWLMGIYLLSSSKKGMSAHQLHRMLGVTYKSAWFMAHRIRYAMSRPPLVEKLSGVVEADETYIGGSRRNVGSGYKGNKVPVLSLVERGGRVRSFPVERVTSRNLKKAIRENVALSAEIMTDEYVSYQGLGREFAAHRTVTHAAKEYVRGSVHTNTVEGYFGNLKRGINGVYHHVGQNHLHRYLAEFDFRYNRREQTDWGRMEGTIRNAAGRRLVFADEPPFDPEKE